MTTITGTSGDDVINAPIAGQLVGLPTNGFDHGFGPAIDFSPDGSKIAFQAEGTNIVPGAGSSYLSEIYVADLSSGSVTLVSSTAAGVQADSNAAGPFFSDDGQSVAFSSWAPNLTSSAAASQVLLKNLNTGALTIESASAAGVPVNNHSGINGFAGGKIFFASPATNLVPGITDGITHEYVKDVATGAIAALPGVYGAISFTVSDDGSKVAFISPAAELDPAHSFTNLAYVQDLATGVVTMASVDAGGVAANDRVNALSLSSDGHLLAFSSSATNLVTGDTNANPDIFVKNLTTGSIVRVSTSASGTQADAASFNPVLSPDGNLLAFTSYAGNLAPGAIGTGQAKLFVKDLTSGVVTLVATAISSWDGPFWPVFSPDGSQIAFQSQAGLTPGVVPGYLAFYVKTLSISAVLDGGGGINTASFAAADVGVTVSLALQGTAQATGVGSDTLTNFQNLLGSTHADTLTGDANANVIDGNGGNDSLNGGGGINTASFASAAIGVTVSLALQGSAQTTGVGSVTLSNFQNLAGSAHDDTLTGDSGVNAILGGAGNDVIDGHGGNDALDGGDGINTLSFASAATGVTVSLALQGQTQATGVGQISTAHFQNLTGSAQADTLTGDAGANIISSGGGNDTIDGGAGLDTAAVGVASGAATLIHNNDGSWTVNAGGYGVETLTNIERVRFTDRDIALTPGLFNDLNGDGQADILWRDNGGNVALWNSQGGGAAGFAGQSLGVVPWSWTLLGTGDFNQDGKADILWRNSDGDTAVWNSQSGSGAGAGGGFHGQDLGIVPLSWQFLGTSDFNADGKADILWRDSNGDTAIWNSQAGANVAFIGQDLGIVPTSWKLLGAGDFNADGKADILWRNADGDTAVWNSQAGAGVAFTGVDLGVVPADWTLQPFASDFNGDGRADILWRNANGDLVVWTTNADFSHAGQDLGIVPMSWQLLKVGDFNGDGKADILWRNSDGDTAVWNSQAGGAVAFSGQDLGIVPGVWHS